MTDRELVAALEAADVAGDTDEIIALETQILVRQGWTLEAAESAEGFAGDADRIIREFVAAALA